MQAGLPRQVAYLRLCEPADGQQRPRQLLLPQPEEDVGLILARVNAAPQRPPAAVVIAAAVGMGDNARVVAGGDEIRVQHCGAPHQKVELDAVVAGDAGVRRAPAPVLLDEVADDVLAELAPRVHHVVRNPDGPADAPRILDVLYGAAALMLRRHAVGVGIP